MKDGKEFMINASKIQGNIDFVIDVQAKQLVNAFKKVMLQMIWEANAIKERLSPLIEDLNPN